MTLDEAIQHAEEVANNGCDQCARDHQQLVDWLRELKELRELGWHPASELPPVNENLISELVLCWCVDSTFHTLEPKLGRVWRGEWCSKDVKWWCYPPKED